MIFGLSSYFGLRRVESALPSPVVRGVRDHDEGNSLEVRAKKDAATLGSPERTRATLYNAQGQLTSDPQKYGVSHLDTDLGYEENSEGSNSRYAGMMPLQPHELFS